MDLFVLCELYVVTEGGGKDCCFVFAVLFVSL